MNLPNRPTPLPEGIEALMVKHYADPVMGGPLRVICAVNSTTYGTRALFDLFLAEWRSRKIRPSTYPMYDSALQTTVPGVEVPLLAWLTAADAPQGEDRRRIVGFIGRRHHAPAVQPFVAMLRKGDPDAVTIVHALLEIGGPEAVEAAIDQVAVLRTSPPRDNADAWQYLAGRIAGLPASVPIPYKRFRAVLPEGQRNHSLRWLSERKDLDALPDALAFMGDPGGYPAALEVLIATDSPDVWKRARAEVERLKGEGRLNDGQYRYASSALDGKIADPAKHFAEKLDRERGRRFSERGAAIEKAKSEARLLRGSDPARYRTAMHAALADDRRLLAEYAGLHAAKYFRDRIAADYLELGHVVRFRMKRPAEAMAEYAESERFGARLGGLAIADTRQHELRDKAGAIAQYRKLAGELSAEGGQQGEQEALRRWMIRWLQAQERYLVSGEVFAGTIGREDLAGGMLMGMAGFAGTAGQDDPFDLKPLSAIAQGLFNETAPDIDRREVARVFAGVPTSSFVLMRTAWFVGLLPDAETILAYLRRQDPAGFASASIFGVVDHAQRQPEDGMSRVLAPGLAVDPKAPSALATAKDRFLRERRVRIAP